MTMKIRFHSAPCGSGKTHAIVCHAVDAARRGRRVVVAQPTRELIDRTVKEELAPRLNLPPYRVFHGGTASAGTVVKALMSYLNDLPVGGQIIFITHAVLPLVPFWPNQEKWDLLIDEELQVLRRKAHRLPQNHGFFTDHLSVEPVNSIYGRVIARDDADLQERARNRERDEVLGLFSDTDWTLVNPHWDTVVNMAQYEKVAAGRARELAFHSILQPSVVQGFRTVFMAAANLEDTPVFKLWSDKGIVFKKDLKFGQTLRSERHTNGHLVTIYFASSKQWSRKKAQSAAGADGETTFEVMVDASKKLFGDEPFLWAANKRVPDGLFGGTAVRLPNKPHGLNLFMGINNIAFLSALNPTPDHFRFLETHGLTGGEVRKAIYFQIAYQAVMRTSLRDPASTTLKRILVPDQGLGEYFHALFPGSRLELLELGLKEEVKKPTGRPKVYASGREKTSAHRRRKKTANLLNGLSVLHDSLVLMAQDADGTESCRGNGTKIGNETSKNLITYSVTQLTMGTLYQERTSKTPMGYLTPRGEAEFIEQLKEWSTEPISSKEKAPHISPAIFDPDKASGGFRTRDHIVFVRHLWLDFENGDLRPEEMPELFPYLRMVITNTYRHTAEAPRFRVIIPTTRPVIPEVYEVLFDGVAAKLKDAGYAVPNRARDKPHPSLRLKSGLDRSKRPATSLFHLPSQAEDPSQSFFWTFLDGGRQTLDPVTWIENSTYLVQPDPDPLEAVPLPSEKVNAEAVQAAVTRWRESRVFPGKGGELFFNFALDLRTAGMDLFEIEMTLKAEAAHGRSPKEREDQITSIMNTLRSPRR